MNQLYTLDSLLQDLEKSASDASDKEAEDKAAAAAKVTAKDEEEEDGDKSVTLAGKKDQEKTASAAFKAGSDLAKEIMEKVAASKTTEQTNKGEEMNKQASYAGKALAQALLKQAGVGDESTSNGIPAGVVPNKTQVDLAQQRAEHDMSFQATPGTDGLGNGGTINQIFDAIVSDAMASTSAKDEQETGNTAHAEGAINDQVPAQVGIVGPAGLNGTDQEKTAAVIALVNSGLDFDEAVNLVKQASDELEEEHEEQVKQAAFNELLDSGVDFDFAVALIKSASKMQAAKAAVGKAYGTAHAYGTAAKEMAKATGSNIARKAGDAVGTAHAYGTAAKEMAKATGSNIARKAGDAYGTAHAYGTAAKEMAKATGSNAARIVKSNPKTFGIAAGVGATGLGGAAGYALGREKKAAVDGLIDAGVDFDTAVNLVNAKADELYGY
jgi:hypothetical protein